MPTKTSAVILTAGKSYAQDTGAPALLNASGDYDAVLLRALQRLDRDKPRVWVFDYTVVTAGFRFVLSGSGQIMPAASALNGWIDGSSALKSVIPGYLAASQGQEPLDENVWRVTEDPAATVLEFLDRSVAVGQVLRLTYTNPYRIGADNDSDTSVKDGDVVALQILLGALICEGAAIRFAQNTGNSNLLGDVVDRRSMSDIMNSRAKLLMESYKSLVGAGDTSKDGLVAASGSRDLDIESSHGRGFLWHPTSNR